MTNKTKNWEERLKQWRLYNFNKELGNFTTCGEEVKHFIKTLMLETLERLEMKKKSEFCEITPAMKKYNQENDLPDFSPPDEENIGYNLAVEIINQKIESIKKRFR